jgi:catechol 2,3-dioxygenase-like lactoylglutathione lyase family enzyme
LNRTVRVRLEVVTLPVSDDDAAKAFYTEQAGFTLDVDYYHPAPGFRVVQLTPPGSACSVQIGAGLTDAPPGSARATMLAVTDIEAATPGYFRRSATARRHRRTEAVGDHDMVGRELAGGDITCRARAPGQSGKSNTTTLSRPTQ